MSASVRCGCVAANRVQSGPPSDTPSRTARRDPAGERFIQLWREEGVDASAVLRSADRATAVYFVTHGPAGHEFLYYRRDSAAAGFGPADVPEALLPVAFM